MYIGIEIINRSLPDVHQWVSPCELLYFSSKLETYWKKSGIRTKIEWFRPSRNRFPSVSLLHSNGRVEKKNAPLKRSKRDFFSFAKLYVEARKILINTVVTAVERWMRLYLLLLFSRRVSDAIFIQRAPLIVHCCLAWRTTSLLELKTRRRPCCLRAFQKKRWGGGGGFASHRPNAK